jgi:hypothetical protein
MSVDLEVEPSSKLIARIVDSKLEDYGQFVCDIFEGENMSGDPSYFIEVCFNNQAQRVPASITVELRSKLRTELLRAGDLRFPYLSYKMDQ